MRSGTAEDADLQHAPRIEAPVWVLPKHKKSLFLMGSLDCVQFFFFF